MIDLGGTGPVLGADGIRFAIELVGGSAVI